MKHMQAAYETLIDKLQADLKEAVKDGDRREYQRMDVERILRDFIYKHHGKKVLMALADEIDKKLGRENDYTQFVDCEYDD